MIVQDPGGIGGGPVERNGEGPFRLGGEELEGPIEDINSLPLYPPPVNATLGKVNIVIFSGNIDNSWA